MNPDKDLFQKFNAEEIKQLRKTLSEMSGKSEDDVVKDIYEHTFIDNGFFDTMSKTMSAVGVMFQHRLSECKTPKERNEIVYDLMISVTVLLSVIPIKTRETILSHLLNNNENIDKIIRLHKHEKI